MDQKLSGGAKVGYFFLGLFLALVGVLIAWLVNKDKPVMKEAVKMSVIGFVVAIVLYIVYFVLIMVLATQLGAF